MAHTNTKTKQDVPAPAPLIWMADTVTQTPLCDLKPYKQNNRIHNPASIKRLATSVETFGFVVPILIDRSGVIIAGHGRYEAAKMIGLPIVPTVLADHLSAAQARALRIADNRLAELSDWNETALQIEFADLAELDLAGELDFDLDVTGFNLPQIDIIIGGNSEAEAAPTETVEDPDPDKSAVTQPGDLWILGDHRLYCGDALAEASHRAVLQGEVAAMIFTDPPYNVAVQGHVRSGNGSAHREFAMASGEMSKSEFRSFLKSSITRLVDNLCAGGVAMICMDWRHVEELIGEGRACGLDLINLCVWNKTNGGMGSLYRSKHELVCVFKKPGARHVNNVELGKHGRNRTNVWDYAGVNSFGAGRDADLVDHPTVKPTALVADAILDVSQRGSIVLDAFGGSGATLLAAEKAGRRARLIELDPLYVDVAIRRWQEVTGQEAALSGSGETFNARNDAIAALTEKELKDV
ncbi:DNA methyltransferase [Sulfitobacter sp. HNIBRBA3233]|uniref:site-specific DNA-methyltransferase n=1 Tax=Sulfitobacter marinivivus TaxID=3158558 RepID=UPI0032DF38A5